MPDSNHILVVPRPKSSGKTYVIGDVHGEIETLNEVLAGLTPDDILIIAGDLIDRGCIFDKDTFIIHPTSQQVLETLLMHANAPAGTLPKIYAIKGNHEEDFLNILTSFEQRKLPENPHSRQWSEQLVRKTTSFIHNGGAWIFNRPDNTEIQDKRFCAFRDYGYSHSSENHRRLILNMKSLFESQDIFKEILPQIHIYREYIASLPFVIKVEGDKPVLVVHADLPFSDAEIDDRIAAGEGFSSEEIRHMTGARVSEFSKDVRDRCSHLVVVGHNIIDDPNSSSPTRAVPVRSDTNHINLDGGAYFTKAFLLLDVTKKEIKIVGENLSLSKENERLLHYGKTKIAAHIRTWAQTEDRSKGETEDQPASKRMRL
jgi:GTP:adenosylcobinamide-phosphate guanylyltransferase